MLTAQDQRRIMLEVVGKKPRPAHETPEEAAFRKRFAREVANLPKGATMDIPSEIEVEGADD
jgi:hypothetical protein